MMFLGLGLPHGGGEARGSQRSILWVGNHCVTWREDTQELLEYQHGVLGGVGREREEDLGGKN